MSEQQPQQPQQPKQPYAQRGEKPEKQEEKDEKSRQEKNWDEKWRRDPLNAAAWALILVWAGLVLLAENIGLFDRIQFEAWSLIFLGAGAILLLEALVRVVVPAYSAPVRGTIILGIVFVAIGLGAWLEVVWPLVLIGIGLALLLGGLLGRRR